VNSSAAGTPSPAAETAGSRTRRTNERDPRSTRQMSWLRPPAIGRWWTTRPDHISTRRTTSSTDGTARICDRLHTIDRRLRSVNRQVSSGQCSGQVEKTEWITAFWSYQIRGTKRAVVPSSAQAVVIGGGVAGCSVAYHLARLGWTDVVVVEQHDLTE